MKRLIILSFAVALSTSAFAQVWNETGDAINLPPGQLTIGTGNLAAISGNLAGNNGMDVDAFCINVVDFQHFSASTIGSGISDTQLFLFEASGIGVTSDDDDPGGSGFQSVLTSRFLTHNGLYVIAVSGYNTDPSSAGGLIWQNSPFNVERAPDGPGAALPVISWAGDATGNQGSYRIALTGSQYCAVPEPASMLALGAGVAILALRRRRKA